MNELLFSLCTQSDQRWEALVIDDSGCGLVDEAFKNAWTTSKVSFHINSVNLGAVNTWNLGISLLQNRKRYSAISVIHADDVLGKDFIGKAIQAFCTRPEFDVVHFQPKVIGKTGKPRLFLADLYKSATNVSKQFKSCSTSGDEGLAEVLRSNFIYCPTMVFNTKRLQEVKFDSRWKMVADLELVSRLIRGDGRLLSLPSRQYFYRRHEESLTSGLTRSLERFREEIMLYRILQEECRIIGFSKSAKVAERKVAVRLNMLWTYFQRISKLDFSGAMALKELYREEVSIK